MSKKLSDSEEKKKIIRKIWVAFLKKKYNEIKNLTDNFDLEEEEIEEEFIYNILTLTARGLYDIKAFSELSFVNIDNIIAVTEQSHISGEYGCDFING